MRALTAIFGRGVTALACARLLLDRGHRVVLCGARGRRAPTVLLSEDTLRLLAELFRDPRLPRIGYGLAERRIRWRGAGASDVPSPGRSVDLAELVERLEPALAGARVEEDAAFEDVFAEARWCLDATGRAAAIASRQGAGREIAFGARQVVAARVVTGGVAGARRCVLERQAAGWLFYVPTSRRCGSLQLMLPRRPEDPAASLERAWMASALLKGEARVEEIASADVFAAYPRILPRLGASRWLAVGEAAASLDPLSGDGVGAAIRGALLAGAVIDRRERLPAEPPSAALEHYHLRHQRSFVLHLRHLWEHYRPLTASSRQWRQELESTRRALGSRWARRLGRDAPLGFRLEGRSLRRLELVSPGERDRRPEARPTTLTL